MPFIEPPCFSAPFRPRLRGPQEVVAGLRQQVGVARSLKEEAAPEWQDKISKLQELKDIKKSYLDEIQAIKGAQSGLDARTEVRASPRLWGEGQGRGVYRSEELTATLASRRLLAGPIGGMHDAACYATCCCMVSDRGSQNVLLPRPWFLGVDHRPTAATTLLRSRRAPRAGGA
jgi:hypothetical protein